MLSSQQQRAHLIIIERNPSGHRLQYVAHLVEHWDSYGDASLITDIEITDTPEYKEFLGKHSELKVVSSMKHRRNDLQTAARIASTYCYSQIVIPDADHWLPTLMWWPFMARGKQGARLHALIMRTPPLCRNGRPQIAALVKIVLAQLVQRLRRTRLFFLTDALGVVMSRPGYPGISPIRDPVTPSTEDYGGPSAETDESLLLRVGILGAISARKNYGLLVSVLRKDPRLHLTLAGQFDLEAKQFIEREIDSPDAASSTRLSVADRFLSSADLRACIRTLDVVATLHENDSPSGLLGLSIANGTPVITVPGGWLGRVVLDRGIGVACEPHEDAVRKGLHEIWTNLSTYRKACIDAASALGLYSFTNGLAPAPGNQDNHDLQ